MPSGCSLSGHHVAEQLAKALAHLRAWRDEIDETVLEEELCGLEAGGEVLMSRFFNHAGAGESDHAIWLGHVDVPEGGETGGDATCRRVGENRDIRKAGRMMTGESTARLRHLHEAENSFVHPRSSGGADDNGTALFFGRGLDRTGEFFPDRGTEAATEEAEIDDAEGHGIAEKRSTSADDPFFKAGLFLVGLNLVSIAFEAERIDGLEGGIEFVERIGIEQHLHPLLGGQGEVMITFGANAVALLQGDFIDDRATGGTFIPQAFRHVGFLFPK